MEDQRKQVRKYIIAEVKIDGLKKKQIGAMAINISEDGIGVYTGMPLDIGEKIAISVTVLLSDSKLASEVVSGTIRWIRKIEKSYAMGIQFDKKIHKKDFPILARCLEFAQDDR